jgi:arylsulfatase A-like enzyme
VDFTDFLPTLVEVSGAEVPDGLPLDGQSFLHRLKGDPGPQREWVFCHYAPLWGDFAEARYVHDTEWKLHEDGRVFNVKTDPREETPLDEEDLAPDVRERLRSFRDVLASKKAF